VALVGRVQRRVVVQAAHQVGVGDEQLAKRHQVGAAATAWFGQGLVVAVVDHPGALAAGGAVGGLERGVVKRAVGELARAAGGAFDDVHIGQAQRCQLAHHVVEQRLRVIVHHVVGGRDRRQAHAGAAAADFVVTARITSSSRRARFSMLPP
jgi:hypothetical protein